MRHISIVLFALLNFMCTTGSSFSPSDDNQESKDSNFALLNRDLEFYHSTFYSSFSDTFPNYFPDDLTIERPIKVSKGSLVYVWNYFETRELLLVDGIHLALSRNFAEDDITYINTNQSDEYISKIFSEINFLCLKDDRNITHYITTILPDNRMVNYTAPTNFQFIGGIIFKKNQEVTLYKNSETVGLHKISEVFSPDCTFGIGYFKLDISNSKVSNENILVSVNPINISLRPSTPDHNELLQRPKNLESGERYYNYELIDAIDLDNDGVSELVFKDIGYEGIGFSIYKFFDDKWKCVYKGGGSGC